MSDSPVTMIDCRGHLCPVPSLRLRKAMEGVAPGAMARLVADDPMARIDVPFLASQAGWELVEVRSEGAATSFLVRKPASACGPAGLPET